MIPTPKKRVTVHMVAQQAGVSPSTVSLTLNGNGAIGEETRRRVLQVAQELGYKPQNRRGTRTRPSPAHRQVALLWFNSNDIWRYSYTCEVLNSGVNGYCRDREYRMSVSYLTDGDRLGQNFFQGLDGLIVAGSPPAQLFRDLPKGFPVVNMNVHLHASPWNTVNIDDELAGLEITTYLLNKGHRRIAFLNPEGEHPFFRMRLTGYRIAHERLGQSRDHDLVKIRKTGPGQTFRRTVQSAQVDELMEELLAIPERPTAIMAANDWVAAEIYRFCSKHGLQIPGDFSVVGCDNDPSICSLLHPGLTTYHVPFQGLGETAARHLMKLIEGKRQPLHYRYLLRGHMVERGSCLAVEPAKEPAQASPVSVTG